SSRERKDPDGHSIFATQSDCSGVHHADPVREKAIVAYPTDHRSIFIVDRISIVHAFHLRSLSENLCLNFHGAQGSRSVSGKIGVTCSSDEYNHSSFLEVPDGSPSNVRLRNLPNLEGTHETGRHPYFLESILKRDAVHHRSQHPHVVGAGP